MRKTPDSVVSSSEPLRPMGQAHRGVQQKTFNKELFSRDNLSAFRPLEKSMRGLNWGRFLEKMA